MPTNSRGAAGGPGAVIPIMFIAAALVALFVIPGWASGRLRWLTAHHILVPAASHPMWTLPGGSAGLDGPRVTLLIVLVVIAVAVGGSALWHLGRRTIHRRLTGGDRGVV